MRAPDSVGIIGNDTYFELDDGVKSRIGVERLERTNIQFALATKRERLAETARQLQLGSALVVATSYPKRLEKVADAQGFGLEEVVVMGGSIESAQDDDPSIDAIFDIVDSGRTLQDNGLDIVRGGLGNLCLDGVWRLPQGDRGTK